ncbi:hypothetical protein [Aliiroseovarius subalbicans]|uniref:hypothetical protein n=1 Tax=Aliiroseovarius subalbicans TaxID=2925840 RepID=UPI001F597564|nr:hypothetical protein [Aliiroseovarius subalbicans]MCI2400789.1 hypothetical protein [Aliiroseovarius subalbicans]
MLVISLTSIPPRFAQLPRVIAALNAQTRPPDRIFLTLPKRYRRFPGSHAPPDIAGVEVLRPDHDPGPAGKVLCVARLLAGQPVDLLYCDDDWDYAPGWAQGFLDARVAQGPDTVLAGATFDGSRVGLPGVTIAQGFAGVMIRPDHLDAIAQTPPNAAWTVDDIWLSGSFARADLPVVEVPGLRALATPLADAANLQDARVDGRTRAQANLACAACVKRAAVRP